MYSQNNEEEHILRICSEEPGRFLDVGAWDGKTFSNTRALAERGWSGVLVEPSRVPFEALQKLYGDDGRFVLLDKAVCEEDGEVWFWESDDAVSTTLAAHYGKWRDHAKFTGRRLVSAITMENILEEYGAFDFVNIDTEGTSYQLFTALDLEKMKPRCICVEHDGHQAEIKARGQQRGYAVAYENAENVILAVTPW